MQPANYENFSPNWNLNATAKEGADDEDFDLEEIEDRLEVLQEIFEEL